MRRVMFAIAITLLASAAKADDLFTLTVPVTVSHLHPSVNQIRVQCSLRGTDPATGVLGPYGPATGKSVTIPITGGAYSGTQTIVFTTADFTPAQLSSLSAVSQGTCLLQLGVSGSWYQPYAYSTGLVVGHASGTPFNSQAAFTIH